MNKSKLSATIFILTVIAFIALSALAIWGIWNKVLTITGVQPISYWFSVAILASIYAIIAILTGSKQLVDFLLLRISLSYAKKRIEKEVKAQAELLKHFKMFDKKE
jgi:hypothetical protein